jgi:hypothetical protein
MAYIPVSGEFKVTEPVVRHPTERPAEKQRSEFSNQTDNVVATKPIVQHSRSAETSRYSLRTRRQPIPQKCAHNHIAQPLPKRHRDDSNDPRLPKRLHHDDDVLLKRLHVEVPEGALAQIGPTPLPEKRRSKRLKQKHTLLEKQSSKDSR